MRVHVQLLRSGSWGPCRSRSRVAALGAACTHPPCTGGCAWPQAGSRVGAHDCPRVMGYRVLLLHHLTPWPGGSWPPLRPFIVHTRVARARVTAHVSMDAWCVACVGAARRRMRARWSPRSDHADSAHNSQRRCRPNVVRALVVSKSQHESPGRARGWARTSVDPEWTRLPRCVRPSSKRLSMHVRVTRRRGRCSRVPATARQSHIVEGMSRSAGIGNWGLASYSYSAVHVACAGHKQLGARLVSVTAPPVGVMITQRACTCGILVPRLHATP